MGTTTGYLALYLPADNELFDEQLNTNTSFQKLDAGVQSEHNGWTAHATAPSPHTGHAVFTANTFTGQQTVRVAADGVALMTDPGVLAAAGTQYGDRTVYRAHSYDAADHHRDFIFRARTTTNAGNGVFELMTVLDAQAPPTLLFTIDQAGNMTKYGTTTFNVGADLVSIISDAGPLAAAGTQNGQRVVYRAHSNDGADHQRDFIWRPRTTTNAGVGLFELLTTLDGGAQATVLAIDNIGRITLGGIQYTWPGALPGAAGYTLTTDAAGVLSWALGVTAVAGTANQITAALAAGTVTLSLPAQLNVPGNLGLVGAAARITSDFTTTTFANRALFQSSTVNGLTDVGAAPNGTATTAAFTAWTAATPTNSPYGQLWASTTDVRIVSGVIGTGAYVPLTFWNGGAERMRILTTGGVNISGSLALGGQTASNAAPWIKLPILQGGPIQAIQLSSDGGGGVANIYVNTVGGNPFTSIIRFDVANGVAAGSRTAMTLNGNGETLLAGAVDSAHAGYLFFPAGASDKIIFEADSSTSGYGIGLNAGDLSSYTGSNTFTWRQGGLSGTVYMTQNSGNLTILGTLAQSGSWRRLKSRIKPVPPEERQATLQWFRDVFEPVRYRLKSSERVIDYDAGYEHVGMVFDHPTRPITEPILKMITSNSNGDLNVNDQIGVLQMVIKELAQQVQRLESRLPAAA